MSLVSDVTGAGTSAVKGALSAGADAAGFKAAADEAKMIGNVMVQMLNQTAKQSQDDGTGEG